MAAVGKPHVVCVPYPLQGHIIPMLRLAKLLHYKGFHVTFVNTEFNHDRILESRGNSALDGLPDFNFATIPLQTPPSNSHTSLAVNCLALLETCRKNFLPLFRDLFTKLNDTSSSSSSNPPISCILSDAFLSYSLELSQELHIPNVLVWNMGASAVLSFKHVHEQIKKCLAFLIGICITPHLSFVFEFFFFWITSSFCLLFILVKFIQCPLYIQQIQFDC